MNVNFAMFFSLKYYKSIAMKTTWRLCTTPFTFTEIIKNQLKTDKFYLGEQKDLVRKDN